MVTVKSELELPTQEILSNQKFPLSYDFQVSKYHISLFLHLEMPVDNRGSDYDMKNM